MLKGTGYFASATALALAFAASSQVMAATSWDLPLAWPADNYIVENVSQFADEVSEATDNEVSITLHPGGSLGFKGPEMFSAVRDGLIPIGDMLLNQQTGSNPLLGLESLPYLIDSFDELREFSKAYRPLLDEIFAENNQKILFTIPWPQQQIYATNEINTIEDMEGVKIRTYDRSSTEIFEAAGMTPVQLPWGEVVPSLAAGVIDAVATSSPSAVDGSFWEFVNYGYPTRQTWNTNVVSVNLDYWSELSDKEQSAILEVANRLEPEFWESAKQVDEKMMKTLAENGIKNQDISEELRNNLKERAAPLREAALEEMGQNASKVIERFNAQQ
ncbi:TRAP transporter substrate-binding protein [Halomonas sp. HAL1]|uniref:TRAP transporter substrate-binding protein n=1 Tax=Halomonas sp. HAL1 TaxID=550984 RepID=UPI00022D2997|nr:TRAP transporter substrate-binding protein [Halomonas sp. HAL1]EHA14895.1 TRAP dicarboxylate transporter subunit DctP [Halomonas sp. HAL1]WKV94171.1 TRAP transporter substrate-binding protein [Halomonas sp. HAL1]